MTVQRTTCVETSPTSVWLMQRTSILRCERVVESFPLIVFIEERDKIFSILAVGTNESLFGDLAVFKNLPYRFDAVVADGGAGQPRVDVTKVRVHEPVACGDVHPGKKLGIVGLV